MSNYRQKIAETSPMPHITPCAHQGCPNPAITRDASGWSICRDHHDHAHALKARAELKRMGVVGGMEGARYALSKMAYELANGMKKPMSKAWAYRIVQKQKDGESVSGVALAMAREMIEKEKAEDMQEAA